MPPSNFDSFDQSPLGAFSQSALGGRGSKADNSGILFFDSVTVETVGNEDVYTMTVNNDHGAWGAPDPAYYSIEFIDADAKTYGVAFQNRNDFWRAQGPSIKIGSSYYDVSLCGNWFVKCDYLSGVLVITLKTPLRVFSEDSQYLDTDKLRIIVFRSVPAGIRINNQNAYAYRCNVDSYTLTSSSHEQVYANNSNGGGCTLVGPELYRWDDRALWSVESTGLTSSGETPALTSLDARYRFFSDYVRIYGEYRRYHNGIFCYYADADAPLHLRYFSGIVFNRTTIINYYDSDCNHISAVPPTVTSYSNPIF